VVKLKNLAKINLDQNPTELFIEWFERAKKTELDHPEAATLATCDKSGAPHARIVLVKTADQRGFTFFTNLRSAKSRELEDNPRAALCFFWKSQKHQVRIEGTVEAITNEEADGYFETRPRMSQIGAWASKQSQPLTGGFELEKAIAKFTAQFHVGKIPRPEFWSGFRVIPTKIEFWEDRPFRLHRRRVYTKQSGQWTEQMLFP
jgi:pyridoxamine 5'-phosphate oxidase